MESNDKLEQLLRQMYAQESLHDDNIDTSDIIDEEWTKFEAEHFGSEKLKEKSVKIALLKIAAIFIGLLMLSGIAYATIHLINNSSQKPQDVQTVTASTLRLCAHMPIVTKYQPNVNTDTPTTPKATLMNCAERTCWRMRTIIPLSRCSNSMV